MNPYLGLRSSVDHQATLSKYSYENTWCKSANMNRIFTLRSSPSSDHDAAVRRWVGGRQADRTNVGVDSQVRSHSNQCDIRV